MFPVGSQTSTGDLGGPLLAARRSKVKNHHPCPYRTHSLEGKTEKRHLVQSRKSQRRLPGGGDLSYEWGFFQEVNQLSQQGDQHDAWDNCK